MLDKKGMLLEIGNQVAVNDSKNNFVGTVVDILEDRGTVMIKDQCDEYHEIEPENLKIQD
jgi:hypothetical protein